MTLRNITQQIKELRADHWEKLAAHLSKFQEITGLTHYADADRTQFHHISHYMELLRLLDRLLGNEVHITDINGSEEVAPAQWGVHFLLDGTARSIKLRAPADGTFSPDFLTQLNAMLPAGTEKLYSVRAMSEAEADCSLHIIQVDDSTFERLRQHRPPYAS